MLANSSSSKKKESNCEKLLKLAVNQYGKSVDLQYTCQRRSFYISDTEIQTKYDCLVAIDSFSLHSKSHDSANLAKEQAALLALEFLKSYKSSAVELNLMEQNDRLKNIFKFPRMESAPLLEKRNVYEEETPPTITHDASDRPSDTPSKIEASDTLPEIEEIEGSPIDILQEIAFESSLDLFYNIIECGPVFKADCKVGDQSFHAYNQSKRTAKKLAALKALENLRPNLKVIDHGGITSQNSDMNMVHNFCQKYPYAAEYTCIVKGINFVCNFKLISEDTKKCIIDLVSKEYPTKREAKRDACQLALQELKKRQLLS